MKNIAVVTGASSGMGREFVLQIAEKYQKLDEIVDSLEEMEWYPCSLKKDEESVRQNDEIIKKLENGETISEKTVIMDEKGFDATTITQEDVDNYGI